MTKQMTVVVVVMLNRHS